MINEVQALMLLDEANPVPDMDAYELSEADIAAYLATLIERSSEMTQLDTKPPMDSRRRRPAGSLIAAAAAIFVLGVAIVVITQGNEDTDVATASTLTTLADPATTMAEPTPTTEVPPTTVSVGVNGSSAETFVTALYSGDTEALNSLTFSDADYKDEAVGGAALRQALNVEILSPVACESMGPSLFLCEIGSIDDLASALGLDLYEETHTVSFTPSGAIEVSWQVPVDRIVDDYQAWVFTNYPGTCGGTTESCATNLLSRVDEYLATIP